MPMLRFDLFIERKGLRQLSTLLQQKGAVAIAVHQRNLCNDESEECQSHLRLVQSAGNGAVPKETEPKGHER